MTYQNATYKVVGFKLADFLKNQICVSKIYRIQEKRFSVADKDIKLEKHSFRCFFDLFLYPFPVPFSCKNGKKKQNLSRAPVLESLDVVVCYAESKGGRVMQIRDCYNSINVR